MTDFLITELQHVFQTRRQDYKLLPKRRDLIGWITNGRHALQPHLCRPFQHLLPCVFLAVSFRKSIVIVTDLSLLWSALAVFWTIPPQIICLSTIIIVTSYLLMTGVLILRFQSGWRNKRIRWCMLLSSYPAIDLYSRLWAEYEITTHVHLTHHALA